MKILVTGGLGFIGQHTSKALVKKGHDVIILDIVSPQVHGKKPKFEILKNKKIKFIKGDVRDKNLIKKLIKNTDVIIHFAAETGTAQSMYEIRKYFDTNVVGTATICDVLINDKNNVKKIILASSRAIYGEGKYICKKHGIVYPKNRHIKDLARRKYNIICKTCKQNLLCVPTDEKSALSPVSMYAITKQVQEQLIQTLCSTVKKDYVILRYQNVYGPGQSLKNPYTGILSIFSTLFNNNQDINIFEDGEISRDFVYIDDVVAATVQAVEKEILGSVVLNIGSGKKTSVLKLAKLLKKEFGSQSKIHITGDFRLGDIRHNIADIKVAKKHLNFRPKTDLISGIKKFTKWVKSQPLEKNLFNKSMQELKKRQLLKN